MMPPHCAICKNNLRNDKRKFKLLRFKLTPEEEAANQRMKDDGRVGHPKGAYWFCADHKEQAKTLTHLYINDAKIIMRNKSLWQQVKNFFDTNVFNR